MKEKNKIFSYVKEKFITYYLPQAIGLGIGIGLIVIFQIFIDEEPDYLDLMTIWFFFVLVMTIFLGAIQHFWHGYAKPNRVSKLLKNKHLLKLKPLGFKVDLGNECYSGVYRNYYLIVSIEAYLQDGEGLLIKTFINSENQNFPKKLEKKYELSSYSARVRMGISFGFVPKIEKIQAKIDTLINDLETNNIEPQLFED